MPTAIVIALLSITVISVIANVYLYQNSVSLAEEITRLQNENTSLHKQIAAQQVSQPIQPSTVQLPNQQNRSVSFDKSITSTSPNSTLGGQQSITAVAVKTIPVTDGFFQSYQYVGTVMDIVVDIHDGGKGRVLVNTDVPTGTDFQSSAKTAVKVAQSITGTDLSNKDIIFSIRSHGNATDIQEVDGGSAGGAMTVLLVSELQGKTIRRDILMTGTINSDGSIGPIGGVEQKADAAVQYGAKIFLVPNGQSVYPAESCSQTSRDR